ncbi:MAG TPA: YihY/virulence factor BrkB family protein [Vicinamibacterales bacterium]
MPSARPALRRGAAAPYGRYPFLPLLWSAWQEYQRDYARYFAASMVYYALFSLVPLLMLLLSSLGLLLRFSEVAGTVGQEMLAVLDTRFGPELPMTVKKLLDQLQQQSVAGTVAGLIGLLVTASVLFRNLRLSFRAIWKRAPLLVAGSVRAVVRATVLEHVTAYLIVLLGGLLLVVALLLIGVTQWMSAVVRSAPHLADVPDWLFALPTSFMLVTLTFALLLKFLPPVRLSFRAVWRPAVLCAVGWLIAAEILTLYGIFVGRSPSASGAIAGLLMIMLWMNVVSQVLFFGGELCKVMAAREGAIAAAHGTRDSRPQDPDQS